MKYLVQFRMYDGEWIESLIDRSEIIHQVAMDRLADIYTDIIIHDVSNGKIEKINLYDIVDEEEILRDGGF